MLFDEAAEPVHDAHHPGEHCAGAGRLAGAGRTVRVHRELDDTQGDYQTPQVILYTALRLPNLAFEMLPVAALIGSLLGLGALAGNSEIIVMRSAGLSVRAWPAWSRCRDA